MSIEGVWESRGYGWVMELSSSGYALFDNTPHACIEFERGTAAEFDAGFEVLARDSRDHLAICVRHDITRYDFDRIDQVPEDALYLGQDRETCPALNLEFFCDAFAQDYAFFDLRGLDWEEASAFSKTRIHEDSSPDELFEVLHELIQPLRDNHVHLTDGTRTVNSERLADIKALLQTELPLRSASIGDPYKVGKIGAFVDNEFLGGEGRLAGNGAVIWGLVAPTVGYLNVLKFFGLTDTEFGRTATDLPPRRPDHGRRLREDLEKIEEIMDQAMADIGDANAVILDVRLNGGGFDKLGMAIAGRFTDKKRPAFSKHARFGAGVTDSQQFFLEPHGKSQFTRPVYVLTSARTASAGDIFAMCMRSLPNVTLVGQPSTGILSDNLKKHLPNGWTTSLSNEYYCSTDGQLFEGPGVPVDVETPVFVQDDFRAGYHVAFDKALEMALANVTKV